MNVILLRDIEKLGTQGEVVKVKPGYARNYLIPSGLAVWESPERQKALKEQARQQAGKRARSVGKAQGLKKEIEGRKWTVKLSVGADDKTFGAVTVHDIENVLAEGGVKLDKHAVQLDEPIKTLGVHTVNVRIHPEVIASINVWVIKA